MDKKTAAQKYLLSSPMGVSEDKGAERARRESEALNRIILASLAERVAILDKQGQIIGINDAWLRFGLNSGLNSPESIGPGIDYLEVCRKALETGDDLARQALEGIQSVLERKKEIFEHEYHCNSPSEVRWFFMRAVPLQRPEGGCIITHTDITDCKQAEEDALKQSRILAAAERLGRMGSWEWGFHANSTFHSDELYRLRGFTPQDPAITSEDFAARIHPEDLPWLLREIRQAVKKGNSFHYEYRSLDAGGAECFMEMHGEVILDSSGKPRRIIGVTQDITGHKRAEMELRQTLAEVERLREQLELENVYLRNVAVGESSQANIIGNSMPLRQMLGLAEKVSPTDSPVLITGETGTGKELLAQAIHDLSPRSGKVMIKVNCASLPELLIESELFGREKGAYTGALTREVGRFELADDSTLFLDEIAELPIEAQGKLLRVLEEGMFERLGSPHTRTVNVRVIAATNRNLASLLQEGRFRDDLFYRLNVFPIVVPTLRERREDIPLLVWRFVSELSRKMGKTINSIPQKSMKLLQQYPWPGNVRELRNVVERALILSDGPTLRIEIPSSGEPGVSPSLTLKEVERRHILKVLKRTGWRVAGTGGAAEILGLKRTTLESRMKKLGIRRPQGAR